MGFRILLGDCITEMAELADDSVDAVVTDPPYELGFMGRGWDGAGIAYDVAMWREALRVLKPGGHLLAFGGTRTYHRMACAVEDAGFEIRDSIMWIYGSGFPKSLDVSKAIDKAAGAERQVVGRKTGRAATPIRDIRGGGLIDDRPNNFDASAITAPATPEAERWEGWGTALKPAHEPIVVARKPLIGTVAANVLAHGAGGLNIDGCRIGEELRLNPSAGNKPGGGALNMSVVGMPENVEGREATGRWPANVILDEHAAAEMDAQSGVSASKASSRGERHGDIYGGGKGPTGPDTVRGHNDTGGASRFMYCAKAPTKERPVGPDGTKHPTVKPLALMRWLVRLVTPPGGTVLDPFAGSGTTVEAAILENLDVIGIEMTAEFLPLIAARIRRAQA